MRSKLPCEHLEVGKKYPLRNSSTVRKEFKKGKEVELESFEPPPKEGLPQCHNGKAKKIILEGIQHHPLWLVDCSKCYCYDPTKYTSLYKKYKRITKRRTMPHGKLTSKMKGILGENSK